MIPRNAVPSGFEKMDPRGPFTIENGPFYIARGGLKKVVRYAFYPEEKHCNASGFTHGGMLATFLDSSMARTVADTFGFLPLTVEMCLNFKGLVATKYWAIADVSVEKIDSEHVRAEARLKSRGVVCTAGKGTFKLMLNHPMQS